MLDSRVTGYPLLRFSDIHRYVPQEKNACKWVIELSCNRGVVSPTSGSCFKASLPICRKLCHPVFLVKHLTIVSHRDTRIPPLASRFNLSTEGHIYFATSSNTIFRHRAICPAALATPQSHVTPQRYPTPLARVPADVRIIARQALREVNTYVYRQSESPKKCFYV